MMLVEILWQVSGMVADCQKFSFRCKNPDTGNYTSEISLETDEFIRRFLMHILPMGFYKIRYSGILSPFYSRCLGKQSIPGEKPVPLSRLEDLNAVEVIYSITGKDPLLSQRCKTGIMSPVGLLKAG